MRRFVAILSFFTATLMLMAMMVLPHHHHHEVLVIAHSDCSEAPAHDAANHEKESCEVHLFITSIIRDDAATIQFSFIPSVHSDSYPVFDLLFPVQSPVALPAKWGQTGYPPFYEPLYSGCIAQIQGLRAPPMV